MQTNILLSPGTIHSVDAQINKLLKDLGNPEPPISLTDVRTLLKLDIGYYSTQDTTWLSEKIHQLKVAGKQVLSKPEVILNVTKLLNLKGLLLIEQRRILLDTDIPTPKLRWNEAHEISHDIRSESFSKQFTSLDVSALFTSICLQCHGRKGPIGSGAVSLANDRGDIHIFRFETFHNGHDALTLAHC